MNLFMISEYFSFAFSNPTLMSVHYNEEFRLGNGCLLYLFICKQLGDRGIITAGNRRGLACFRLIEPITLTDDFGTWQYDHWRGLFDLELSPRGANAEFPIRWRLADDARIHCRIEKHDSVGKISSSSNGDRPRTASLDVFVEDVCAHENNGQKTAWLDALHKEDILTYEHLANLRQSEWDNKLPMNAKKILKAAIDRERESVASDRHRRVTSDSDQEDDDDNIMVQDNTSKHIVFFPKKKY
jgi:hypothetical protein